MPIYIQTYRKYTGEARARFRWLTILNQELKIFLTTRNAVTILLLSAPIFFFYLFEIMAYDMIQANPTSPTTMMFRNLSVMKIKPGSFMDFLTFQSYIVVIVSIAAGCNMISGDRQNNLAEIYFSKPITWIDYVLGKSMALIALGLSLTTFPALFLLFLHGLMLPTMQTLNDFYWVPLSILGYSLVVIIPCTFGILAASAIFSSGRYAGIGFFMLLTANTVIGRIMPEMLANRAYALLAIPLAVHSLGEYIFLSTRITFDLKPEWALIEIAVLSLICLLIVCNKARHMEKAI